MRITYWSSYVCSSVLDAAMLNIISILIGIVALLFAIPAFIPFLGWANWLIIPLAAVGAGIGMLSNRTSGRNLNLFVIVVGIVRLMMGGGIKIGRASCRERGCQYV